MGAMKRLAVAASASLALAAVLASQAWRAPELEPVVPVELRHPSTDTEDDPARAPPSHASAGSSPASQQPKTVEAQPATPIRSRDDLLDDLLHDERMDALNETTGTPSSRPGEVDDPDKPAGGDKDEQVDGDD
jgi:hypothetical protein